MSAEFEQIYQRHYEKLFTLAFRMTGNREDAEDVLQTGFLQAYKAFDSFRYESSVYTWLYRILLNAAKRHVTVWNKMPITELAETRQITEQEIYSNIGTYGQSEDEALISMVKETCLQMFMNCMPSRYRAVFTLRSMLHFSIKETAEIMEISESAVKVYLHRARKIARSHMEGKCSLIEPGSMCDCRSFAAYLQATGKQNRLKSGIDKIIKKEEKASQEFRQELTAILETESLYQTRFSPGRYPDFVEQMKKMRKKDEFKILGA